MTTFKTFKLFKPPSLILPRDAGEERGGGWNDWNDWNGNLDYLSHSSFDAMRAPSASA
jgi:hypothetical protein